MRSPEGVNMDMFQTEITELQNRLDESIRIFSVCVKQMGRLREEQAQLERSKTSFDPKRYKEEESRLRGEMQGLGQRMTDLESEKATLQTRLKKLMEDQEKVDRASQAGGLSNLVQ